VDIGGFSFDEINEGGKVFSPLGPARERIAGRNTNENTQKYRTIQ
jgi:hypothetical protein